MNNLVKQRVIGAVVLVALAVIFVPMLFEEPEDDLGPIGNNLPAKPEKSVTDRIEPLTLPEPPPDPAATQVVIGDTAATDTAEATLSTPGEAAETVAPVVETVEPTPVAAPAAAASAPAPAAEPTPAPITAAPAPAAPAAQPAAPAAKPLSGWVVQLASLSKKENALALSERLRKLGYTAFVEEAQTAKGVLYRVRVGPELERSNADQLRDRLEEQVQLKGMVTSYP